MPQPVKEVLYGSWFKTDELIDLNGWSFVHAGFGFLFGKYAGGYIEPTYLNLVLVHSGWEAFQLAIGMTKPTTAGAVDIAFDTAFSLAGLWLYNQTNK